MDRASTNIPNGSGNPDEYKQNCYDTEHTASPLLFPPWGGKGCAHSRATQKPLPYEPLPSACFAVKSSV